MDSVEEFLQQQVIIFENVDFLTRNLVESVIIITLLVVLLRALLVFSYKKQLSMVRDSRKEKVSKILKGVVEDYQRALEAGIAEVNTEMLVKKYMLKSRTLIFKSMSLGKTVAVIERQAIIVLAIAILMLDVEKVYCLVWLVIMLVVIWLTSTFFDFETARDELETEVINYVDNEKALFRAKDLGSAIVSLRNELKEVLLNTNTIINDSINNMNSGLGNSIKDGTDNMVSAVESAMKSLVSYSEILKEPIEQWEKNIVLTSVAQKDLSDTMEDFRTALGEYKVVSDKLNSTLEILSNDNKEIALQTRNQVEQLFVSAEKIKDDTKEVALNNEALEKQLDYIDSNQKVLEATIQQYISAIEAMTANIGKILGSVTNIYADNITDNIDERLKTVVSEVLKANQELLDDVNQKLEKVTLETKAQKQAVFDLKEIVYTSKENEKTEVSEMNEDDEKDENQVSLF